jgi:alcohol dehydrogenase class IV
MKKKQHDQHGLLDAATLAGAAAGATTGLVAGPPGVIAGGAIGTAVGYLAGVVLEEESERAAEREAKTDEELGVSGQDIGAREAAVKGMQRMEKRARAERGHAVAREKALERSLEKAERKG